MSMNKKTLYIILQLLTLITSVNEKMMWKVYVKLKVNWYHSIFFYHIYKGISSYLKERFGLSGRTLFRREANRKLPAVKIVVKHGGVLIISIKFIMIINTSMTICTHKFIKYC